ncbi:low molecular weight protein arginine phosphatase [Paenibacillus eucommiae]|uniref:Protein-tyrosine phosphatase n=1 Tax=Paenibacillus eucommiae TaxID=1355755 RepID=A0ABS4IYH6_9BACL|nr:low molecular weight protein arginine phosphatase [Paenibacillus eucommiae]MBP1992578.1 protein-tyrosine phosphatase [Paenibacillus eucommiae]
MLRILFVCTGNTCRSPIAEGMLRMMLQRERFAAEVRSAGVSAFNGGSISSNSAALLQEAGFNERLVSSALSTDEVEWADLILTMTVSHKGVIIQRYPYAIDKTFTLKEYAEDDPAVLANIEEREQLAAELQMKQALSQFITAEERSRMMKLSGSLPDYDISDPFGGSLDIYRKTAAEIEYYLKKLVFKLLSTQDRK